MNAYNSKYRQSSSLKTYHICEDLDKANGDVKLVIERIGKRFCKQDSNSIDPSKPKAKNRKDLHILYTLENIEKEREIYSASPPYGRINFEIVYDLYRRSLNFVTDYFKQNHTLSNYESFCLYFFLANLYSRLPELDLAPIAAQNYAKAFAYSAKIQELSSPVSETLRKHRAICISDGVYEDISIEDALLSRTYIDREIYSFFNPDSLIDLSDAEIRKNDDLSVHGINDLPQLFKSIGSTKFSQLVLKINALDSIMDHSRFRILFVIEMKKKSSLGNYNHRNTVRVLAGRKRENIRESLFHELTHKTMNRLFDNWSIPYSEKDENAKLAYRASMRQVLLNLINFSCVSKEIDIDKLAFNDLVQFCFGEKSSSIIDGIKEKDQTYVLNLFQRLQIVFVEYYPVSQLDLEFITNALQYLINVENDSPYVRCVQPLLDFIDKFVIPQMENYIDHHPCKKRLQLMG